MKKLGRKICVFLDASVCIAATLSQTGGSFRLFKEARDSRIAIVTNKYALMEVELVLARKYSEYAEKFTGLAAWSGLIVGRNPSMSAVKTCLKLVNAEDAPILAGAKVSRADFLITLDRKHFLTQTARKKIGSFMPAVSPAELFQEYWR